jgi:hypothetical protein
MGSPVVLGWSLGSRLLGGCCGCRLGWRRWSFWLGIMGQGQIWAALRDWTKILRLRVAGGAFTAIGRPVTTTRAFIRVPAPCCSGMMDLNGNCFVAPGRYASTQPAQTVVAHVRRRWQSSQCRGSRTTATIKPRRSSPPRQSHPPPHSPLVRPIRIPELALQIAFLPRNHAHIDYPQEGHHQHDRP